MDARYDVFVSHTWATADLAAVRPLVRALRDQGVRVFIDESGIDTFARITPTIRDAVAASKVLLAFYSAAYPKSKACQWELTAAYLAAQRAGEDPAERILVVNPENGFDHLYLGELRDSLAASAPDDHAGLAALAGVIAERARQVVGPLGMVAPLVRPRWLPTQGLGLAWFVGRLPELWRLHAALYPETTRLTVPRSGPAVALVCGLGGVGKTLLAEEYALRFSAAYPGGVFWLRAAGSYDRTDLRPEQLDARRHGEVVRIAQLLGITTEGLTLDQVTGAVARVIEAAGQPCLWVVDDLPVRLNAHQVRRWLSPHPLARTLFTTRSQTYRELGSVIDLDVLADQDGFELLTIRRPPGRKDEEQAAYGIVEALGRLPLALDVAGAYTQKTSVSYGDYQRSLSEPDKDALELASELADTLPTGHHASIAHTLLRSISQLDDKSQDFLRLAANLADDPIPVNFVAAVFQQVDGRDARQATREACHAVALAKEMSLARKVVSSHSRGQNWLVHALVARTIRFRKFDQQRRAALRKAATAALPARLQELWDARAYLASQAELPHARELVHQAEAVSEAALLGWVARYDQERGAFGLAANAYRRQLKIFGWRLGEEHPDTLAAMSDLALSLRASEELAEAEELQGRVLTSRQRMSGDDDPSTLTAKSDLAETLWAQGRLTEAKKLHEQVLEARRRVLGEEHQDTLQSMNALAMTLLTQGRQALRRWRQEPYFDAFTWNEAPPWMLAGLGELMQARELLEQVVASSQRRLGEDHPSTLTAKGNLAATLAAEGERDEAWGSGGLNELMMARELEEQVLAGMRRRLGEDHPSTLVAKGNLAESLRMSGELMEARELFEEVLAGMRRVLGKDNPATLAAGKALARTLRALGQPAAAQDPEE
jgi:hypothetical protein